MNILCVAHERRAAEAVASALRRISPQVRVTWAQTRASALDWLRNNRNTQAVLVDSGAEDAHGPAFLEQIRTLGVTIPVAVVSTEQVEWLGAAVTSGKDAIRGQERQRAATSEDNAVAMIHLDLADAYEERANDAGRIEQPTLIPRRSA